MSNLRRPNLVGSAAARILPDKVPPINAHPRARNLSISNALTVPRPAVQRTWHWCHELITAHHRTVLFRAASRGVQGISGRTPCANDISGFCAAHHVSFILIGPGTRQALIDAMRALNWETTDDHGVQVVHVPDQRSLRFYYVTGDYWPADKWMGKTARIVTHRQPLELRITGQYRPSRIEPVEIRLADDAGILRFLIGNGDSKTISIPANASITVTANATFGVGYGSRQMSVTLSLEPK